MDPFPGTRWSLVIGAGQGHEAVLEELCLAYWHPLYGFARRRGYSEPDSQDLVQGFLARFIERNDFTRASPERGRFRAYLLASFKNHMARVHEKQNAKKRGGGAVVLSLEWDGAEGRYRRDPVEELTPEHLYERQWALTVVDRSIDAVRARYDHSGQAEFFQAFVGVLTGLDIGGTYAEIGKTLGMAEGAVKVAVHRLKKRFREALRAEVERTVESSADVDAELRFLLETLV